MTNTSDATTSESVPSAEKQESNLGLLARSVEEAKAATRRTIATNELGVERLRQLTQELEREPQEEDDLKAFRSVQRWLKKKASEMRLAAEQSRERLRRLCQTSERIASKQATSKKTDAE